MFYFGTDKHILGVFFKRQKQLKKNKKEVLGIMGLCMAWVWCMWIRDDKGILII